MLLPPDEKEDIEEFKKEEYAKLTSDQIEKIKTRPNFSEVFENCTNFPLVLKKEYETTNLLKELITKEGYDIELV